ncbi:hypothetical protein ACHAWF_018331 [Thalassiosira exigua]
MYNIYDPNEMTKVVRSEGDRPSGIVEKLWAWRRAMKDSGSALVSKKEIAEDGEEYDYGLFDKGDVWKRHRTFLQTGMLDPKAARGFIPGIIEAAATASEVAPNHGEKVNDYLNYTAFDPTVKAANAENERFVTAALGVFETTNQMNMFPHHYLITKYLPFYKTSMYKELEKDWTTVREIGLKKIHDFIDRYDRNELDDMEKKSYLAGAIERQRQTKEVSQDEMAELCLIALFVGVDTTSSVTAWNLMHLALNPDVQQKLNDELTASLKEKGSEGTKLNADVLGKKVSPYLHMCIRESHRITPAFVAAMWKTNSKKELDIHGVTMPKGCMFQMGHISYEEA